MLISRCHRQYCDFSSHIKTFFDNISFKNWFYNFDLVTRCVFRTLNNGRAWWALLILYLLLEFLWSAWAQGIEHLSKFVRGKLLKHGLLLLHELLVFIECGLVGLYYLSIISTWNRIICLIGGLPRTSISTSGAATLWNSFFFSNCAAVPSLLVDILILPISLSQHMRGSLLLSLVKKICWRRRLGTSIWRPSLWSSLSNGIAVIFVPQVIAWTLLRHVCRILLVLIKLVTFRVNWWMALRCLLSLTDGSFIRADIAGFCLLLSAIEAFLKFILISFDILL